MMEIKKLFEPWCRLKQNLDERKNRPIFFEREIWWCHLGVNIGFEQDGKGNAYTRPVLVLKKFNSRLLLVVPLSTKIKPDNPHYFAFELHGKQQSAIISQVKTIDSKRLLGKMARLSESKFDVIKDATLKHLR